MAESLGGVKKASAAAREMESGTHQTLRRRVAQLAGWLAGGSYRPGWLRLAYAASAIISATLAGGASSNGSWLRLSWLAWRHSALNHFHLARSVRSSVVNRRSAWHLAGWRSIRLAGAAS